MLVATRSIGPLLARLQNHAPLSEAERQALSTAVSAGQSYLPDQTIGAEGSAAGGVHILVEGIVQRHKALSDGTRQIIAIALPGDILDLSAFLRGGLDYSVSALTRVVVVTIADVAMRQLFERHPRLSRVFWCEMAHEMAIAQEWMVSLGRRSGFSRVAHFLCETYSRLDLIGAAQDYRCALPLTQSELADALGLSCVHINRVLQQLRREGLISLHSGQLVIKDWVRLAEAGDFNPNYLFPRAPEAAATA